MDNMNIDENTMNNIKNMVDSGNISGAISQISPEMIQNFSKMFNQNNVTQNIPNQNSNSNKNDSIQNNVNQNNYSQTNSNNSSNNNFDFSNIDMKTIMQMSSALGKLNNSKNDPRANLLNSLKPYLRDSKKGKLDNYMNLLNVTKIAEIMKNNNLNNNPSNNFNNNNNYNNPKK